MKLIDSMTKEGRIAFSEMGYRVPTYDREILKKNTYENPTWVHFGPGNIFRAYQAELLEKALEAGKSDTGVIVAESWDYDILDRAFRPVDNMALSVVLHSDGKIEKNVIGCITESLKASQEETKDWERLCEIFRKPSLQMVTFSITEKGYLFNDEDTLRGTNAKFAMGKLTALLLERYKVSEGGLPVTLQSMDNCSHNGDHVKKAVLAYADAFVKAGVIDAGFSAYVRDEKKVTYPWCMIDKITPRPSEDVGEMLKKDGFEDCEIIETALHSFTAPFVNAEEVGYLVVEDSYTNGRPLLEVGGAIYTTRETVDKVERMKVGTCLNPLHTALCTFGIPLGFKTVQDEMKDPDLLTFIKRMVDEESMPVVTDPGIISPRAFCDECIEKRFVNPFMIDTPQRIATDNSQAIRNRYSGTMREYLEKGENLADKLTFIPLIFACYARYLKGIDDWGNAYVPSADPLLDELMEAVKLLEVREGEQDFSCLKKVFCREDVFDMDLYEVGLGEKCEELAKEHFAGEGAARRTLHKYVTA